MVLDHGAQGQRDRDDRDQRKDRQKCTSGNHDSSFTEIVLIGNRTRRHPMDRLGTFRVIAGTPSG
jgi:hypothetical protein